MLRDGHERDRFAKGNNMRTFLCTNIVHDEPIAEAFSLPANELPTELFVTLDEDFAENELVETISDAIADAIADKTGWLVERFEFRGVHED